MDIFVEYTITGWTVLSTVYKGQRYHHQYNGYTLKECKQMFRAYVKGEHNNG